jgi:dihydrofolate synthase / folylpolyglutamate synthase
MSRIRNLIDAEAQLAPFYANTRQNYTLTTMHRLMNYLGNPQETFCAVHIAGTSGKTSTAYYAAALLRATGYRVGLTVSPHVDSLTERLQIDGQPVDEKTFCEALIEFLALIEGSRLKPSWFEVMVAFALWCFAKEKVNYAVVEVGLGGLKDGTNVIERPDKVCIITDIGHDHTRILGNRLADITAHKIGIIKPGNTVFAYRQSDETMGVIERSARRQKADLHIIEAGRPTRLQTLPLFQQRNFHLAEEAVNFILRRDTKSKLTALQVRNAAQTYIPGRMETIKLGNKIIILDGAHNAQKLGALAKSLRAKYPHQKVAVLASFSDGGQDRLDGGLKELSSLTNQLIVTTFVTAKDFMKHSVDPVIVATVSKQYGMTVEIVPDTAQAFMALRARPEPILLVTGSFYLLNHIRPLML